MRGVDVAEIYGRIERHDARNTTAHGDFEARLRILERAHWKMAGFAAGGSAVITFLFHVVKF